MNWTATYYNEKDEVIGEESFNDRTEHEAINEAMGLMPDNCYDWTLTEKIENNEKDNL